jgi:predicted nucleotide-binding protein
VAIRKKTNVSETKLLTELLISRDDAKSRLQERIQKGLELKQVQINSRDSFDSVKNEYGKWNSFNIELLKRIFTTEELSREYSSWTGFGVIVMREPSLGENIAELYKNIDHKIHTIDSIIERLELIPLIIDSAQVTTTIDESSYFPVKTKKVFVVHGHDEIAKANLEVFLRDIGLEPVVLHRQADVGLTTIEKFEKHSDVGYAFILLTPDEIAYIKADENKNDDKRKKEFRARPNVIFEFGFFVGKLGRSRVCCLYTGDVSLPSDISGMIYKKFEKNIEEVAYSIIKDLKASGYPIT